MPETSIAAPMTTKYQLPPSHAKYAPPANRAKPIEATTDPSRIDTKSANALGRLIEQPQPCEMSVCLSRIAQP
jgi:hypothetical protein